MKNTKHSLIFLCQILYLAFYIVNFFSEAKNTTDFCPDIHTYWTDCSAYCGFGYEHRLSNRNPQCLTETQERLCYNRPCRNTTHKTGRRGDRYHHKRAKQLLPLFRPKCPILVFRISPFSLDISNSTKWIAFKIYR